MNEKEILKLAYSYIDKCTRDSNKNARFPILTPHIKRDYADLFVAGFVAGFNAAIDIAGKAFDIKDASDKRPEPILCMLKR